MTELIVICDKLHINYHLSSINYHLLSVIYRLSAVQKSFDVFEYTFSDIASIFFHEFLTGDVFEQFVSLAALRRSVPGQQCAGRGYVT